MAFSEILSIISLVVALNVIYVLAWRIQRWDARMSRLEAQLDMLMRIQETEK